MHTTGICLSLNDQTLLDQPGNAALPLDRVVDASVVEEVLRERRCDTGFTDFAAEILC